MRKRENSIGSSITPVVFGDDKTSRGDNLKVALLGAGSRGKVLLGSCLRWKNSGIRFQAVCDIWKNYHRSWVCDLLRKFKHFGHEGRAYSDYREMLAKEKGLDAVIIATPDFCHAEQTIACLQAGLHVYCETPMARSLAEARKMVAVSQSTGKLLQIGHHRRSDPRFLHCLHKIIRELRLPGRITTVNAYWNSPVRTERIMPEKYTIDDDTLERFGYGSMREFLNWRYYRRLGSGPFGERAHSQLDVLNWFFDTLPLSVMASGGTDFYPSRGYEFYDNVMAFYEYKTKEGIARVFYQTLTTSSNKYYGLEFMGDEGTLVISEKPYVCYMLQEPRDTVSGEQKDKWDILENKKVIKELTWPVDIEYEYKNIKIKENDPQKEEESNATKGVTDSRQSPGLPKYDILINQGRPAYQPHLQNFFDSIRRNDKTKLVCPGEIGYQNLVMVLKTYEAVRKGTKVAFKPQNFQL